MENRLSDLWYDGCFAASMAALTLGFSLRTEGMRHVPAQGPVLLIANHQSFLDPFLVGLAARRHLCFLARKSLFRYPLLTGLMRSLNAVPIDQEGTGIGGLKTILQQLQSGQAVVVFPEGHRTPDGALHSLQPGIQLLIKKGKAPIVPVGIAGAFAAWPRWSPLPIPAPLFLPPGKGTLATSIGPPLDAARLLDLPREELLSILFAEMEKAHARAEMIRRA